MSNLEEFDAFTTLKALREMKKQLDAKQQVDLKPKPVLQYLQKQPLTIYDLRIQFQQQLARLNDLSTRQLAFQSIHQLVQTNQSTSSLSLLISCLQTPTFQKGSDGIVKTIAIIVGIYNLQITVQDIYKLIEIIMKHFNEESQLVQQACAECWSVLYISNVYKRPLQQRTLLLYQTLQGIIAGGSSRQGQATACVVLQQLFETLNEHKDITFFREILKDFFNIYSKYNIDNSHIHIAMYYMILAVTIQNFGTNQIPLIDKILQVINNTKLNYKTRVGACNLMKLIGIQYQSSNFKIVLGNLYQQVIVILDEATRDRIIAVQNVARLGLKEWMKLKLQVDTLQDMQQQQNFDLISSNGFVKKKTGTGGGQVLMDAMRKPKQQQDIKKLLEEDELDKTMDYNNIQTSIDNVWDKANELDEIGQTEDAVQLLINNGDDIYLLRLFMKYKDFRTLQSKLQPATRSILMDSFLQIMDSDFLNILCLDFVIDFYANGLQEWFHDLNDFINFYSEDDSIAGEQCRQLKM